MAYFVNFLFAGYLIQPSVIRACVLIYPRDLKAQTYSSRGERASEERREKGVSGKTTRKKKLDTIQLVMLVKFRNCRTQSTVYLT